MTGRRLMRKSIFRDRRGATIVEFALIAMPLFVLLMGGVEFGVQMFAKARLEGTLRDAARMSITGDPAITGADGAEIDAYVRRQMRIRQGSQVTVDRFFYDSYSQVRMPEKKISGGDEPPYCFIDVNGNNRWDLDPGRRGMGGADDIVDYKVNVSYPALFPLLVRTVTGSDTMSIEARTTLRNEPFAGGSDADAKTCCVSAAAGNPTTCT